MSSSMADRHHIISLGNYTVYKIAAMREPHIMPGIELLLNAWSHFNFTFTFEIRDSTYSVYAMERQYLPHILQD